MDLKKLAEPFDIDDIEWRIQRNGVSNGKPWAMVLAYITNRAIMERLDEACGPENWQNEYREWHGTSQLCGISIYVETKPQVTGFNEAEREWVTKWDGADATAIESTKGGLSDSMKRAGVQWGIGRYLYKLDTNFVDLVKGRSKEPNAVHTQIKENENDKYTTTYYFIKPTLPSWAVPSGTKQPSQPKGSQKASTTATSPRKDVAADNQELIDLKNKVRAKYAGSGKKPAEIIAYIMSVIGETEIKTVEQAQEVLDALNK